MHQAPDGSRRSEVFGALVVALLIVLGIGLPNSAHAQGQRVTLDQAIRQGLIAAEFHGSGDLFFSREHRLPADEQAADDGVRYYSGRLHFGTGG